MAGATSLLALGMVAYRPPIHMSRSSATKLVGGLISVQLATFTARTAWAMYGQDAVEIIALTCGVLGAWVAAWSLVPISRCSPLMSALGIPIDAGLRAHAMLGRITSLLLICHAVGYVIVWWRWGGTTLVCQELRRWNQYGVNNLAGVVAFISLVDAVVAISHESIRRVAYEFFYRVHMLGFIGFALFGVMHWAYFAYFLAPVIMAWNSDLARRTLDMMASKHSVVSVETYENARLLRLIFSPHENSPGPVDALLVSTYLAQLSGTSVYASVNIPKIANYEWHVFSVLPTGGNALEIWVRARGDWTSRLMAHNEDATPLSARLAGISSAGWPLQHKLDNSVFLVAGGTGIVPLLGVLGSVRVPMNATLLWCVRHAEDLAILESYCASGQMLLNRQGCKTTTIALRVYFTGPEDEISSISAALVRCSAAPQSACLSHSEDIQRLSFSIILALYASSFVGMLCGAVAAFLLVDENWPSWQIGTTNLVCMTLGSASAATSCALFLALRRGSAKVIAHTAMKRVEGFNDVQSNPIQSSTFAEVKEDSEQRDLSHLTSVSVQHGRPDIGVEIRSWALSQASESRMSVLASGPRGLVSLARSACDGLFEDCCDSCCLKRGVKVNFEAVSFDVSDL